MRPFALAVLLYSSAPGQTLTGVVDIHAHCDPDSMPRSIDALSLVRIAKERGIRSIVLKNHFESTASWAAMARQQTPGIEVFGGIALNYPVGGINPAAVERMTQVRGGWGRVVWMPTFDGDNHVRVNKQNRTGVAVAAGGALLPAVSQVLDLIARHELVLATGHSSPAEVVLLITEAKKRGVKRIVVTHAMLGPVLMNLDQMKAAANAGALIEFVGNAVVGHTKVFEFKQYADAIRAIGPAHCILSSDLGQKDNPLHPDGLLEIFAGLRKAGLNAAEIDQISKSNPARLLGLN